MHGPMNLMAEILIAVTLFNAMLALGMRVRLAALLSVLMTVLINVPVLRFDPQLTAQILQILSHPLLPQHWKQGLRCEPHLKPLADG